MAKKRTKADRLQRNVQRLATRDAAHRESQSNDKRSEPAGKILDPAQLEDQIRRRAYELYETRGRQDGRDLEDWLRAEEAITGKKVRAATAS